MKSTNWKFIAEIVGITAIVGSLVFVGLQMRQAELLARIEIGTAILGPGQEMRIAIAEHAPIWRKGNAGEELEPDELVAYEQLIWSRWQQAYWTDWSFSRLGSINRTGTHQFAGFLFDNPGARQTWLSLFNNRTERRVQLIESAQPSRSGEIVKTDLEKLDALNN